MLFLCCSCVILLSFKYYSFAILALFLCHSLVILIRGFQFRRWTLLYREWCVIYSHLCITDCEENRGARKREDAKQVEQLELRER